MRATRPKYSTYVVALMTAPLIIKYSQSLACGTLGTGTTHSRGRVSRPPARKAPPVTVHGSWPRRCRLA
ncbi:hypothetical protein D3C80_1425660 [compost metagenome]